MGIFLGDTNLAPSSGGGGGSIVVNGNVVSAPYNSLEQAPASAYRYTARSGFGFNRGINIGQPQAGTHTGTINNNQSVDTEIINIAGAGALQTFRLSVANSDASQIAGKTITVTIDGGTPVVYTLPAQNTSTEPSTDRFVLGGMPVNIFANYSNSGNSSSGGYSSIYGGPSMLNTVPYLSGVVFTGNAMVANVSGFTNQNTSTGEACTLFGWIPPQQLWFGAGLPWIQFNTSLVISYTTENQSGGTVNGSYDAQIVTF